MICLTLLNDVSCNLDVHCAIRISYCIMNCEFVMFLLDVIDHSFQCVYANLLVARLLVTSLCFWLVQFLKAHKTDIVQGSVETGVLGSARKCYCKFLLSLPKL